MARKKSYAQKEIKTNLAEVMPATFHDPMFIKTFKAAGAVSLHKGAGKDWPITAALPEGTKLVCEGNYRLVKNQIWLLVRSGNVYGYCLRNEVQ